MPELTAKPGGLEPNEVDIVETCKESNKTALVVKVVGLESMAPLENATIKATFPGVGDLTAEDKTDPSGQLTFILDDLVSETTPVQLEGSDPEGKNKRGMPAFEIKKKKVNSVTLGIGPPQLQFFSPDLEEDSLEVVQGLVQKTVQLKILPPDLKGVVKLSLVEAENPGERLVNRAEDGDYDGPAYLSRFRLSEETLKRPLKLPLEAFEIEGASEFLYVTGLEPGTETLKAELVSVVGLELDGDKPVSTTLEVKVTRAPTNTGGFRVYHAQTADDFALADVEFQTIYAACAAPKDSLKVAVMDSGIWDDGGYLKDRLVGGKMFTPPPDLVKDAVDVDDISTFNTALIDFHGTHVAGQVSFGTDKIKLLDVKLNNTQMAPKDKEGEVMKPAMEWAASQGAEVITTSVAFDWTKGGIQGVVSAHPNVVFVSTGGNNDVTIEPGARDTYGGSYASGNGVLGGGCYYNRENGTASPHSMRGRGPGVDLMVPADNTTLYSPLDARKNINAYYNNQRRDAWVRKNEVFQQWLSEHPEPVEPKPARLVDRMKPEFRQRVEEWEAAYKEWEAARRKADIENPGDAPVDKDKYDVSGGNTHSDEGISFGVPVIANIASKLKMLCPALTGKQVRNLLINASDVSEGLEGLSKAKGVLNPLRAYLAAFDKAQA